MFETYIFYFLTNICDDNDIITTASLFSLRCIIRIETFIDDQKWNHTVPSVCHVYSNDNQFERRATRIQELRPASPICFLFLFSRFTPLFSIRRPGPAKYYKQNRPEVERGSHLNGHERANKRENGRISPIYRGSANIPSCSYIVDEHNTARKCFAIPLQKYLHSTWIGRGSYVSMALECFLSQRRHSVSIYQTIMSWKSTLYIWEFQII